MELSDKKGTIIDWEVIRIKKIGYEKNEFIGGAGFVFHSCVRADEN